MATTAEVVLLAVLVAAAGVTAVAVRQEPQGKETAVRGVVAVAVAQASQAQALLAVTALNLQLRGLPRITLVAGAGLQMVRA